MAHKDDKAFILDFIECYHSLPALWDTKSTKYSNKLAREQQNGQLLEKYQERYPNASKKEVAKKINNLRSNYKRELKRIKETERSGAGVEDSIDSNLYYFDAMSFIDDVDTPTTSRTTFQTNDKSQPKRKKNDTKANDELIRLATNYVKKPQDACHISASAWGQRLLEMNREQRILAEKLISEIVFNGQLGLLDYKTSLTNLRALERTSTPMTRSNSATLLCESSEDSKPNYNYDYAAHPASTGNRIQNVRPNIFVLPPTPSTEPCSTCDAVDLPTKMQPIATQRFKDLDEVNESIFGS